MNIDLIRSSTYNKIVNEFVKPYHWLTVEPLSDYPFEDRNYYLERMKNQHSINNFNLIKKINIIYQIDQTIYGILNLNNTDYVLSIDDEFTVSVVGDTESNWLCYMFYANEEIEKLALFMKECHDKLAIQIKEPDFDHYIYIEEKFLDPLILGN